MRLIYSMCFGALLCFASLSIAASMPTLSLKQTIASALEHDVWQERNALQQQSTVANADVVAAWPNPQMNLSVANIAADSLAFNQENMSQFKVGLTQQFARGNTLALKKRQALVDSSRFPLLAIDREERLRVLVAQHWFRAYQARRNITLILEGRELFEQLIDLSKRSYQVGHRRTMQSDLISAQVELTVLDDRIAQLKMTADTYRQQLGQWLPARLLSLPLSEQFSPIQTRLLPQDNTELSWAGLLEKHPSVQALDVEQRARAFDIELAQEQKKMQWGVNTSYGWRSDSPMGNRRNDLLSVGVSFDLPMFNRQQQSQRINAAKASAQAVDTDKLLLIRQMRASALSLQAAMAQLLQRRDLYHNKLLPQTQQQSQAALSAYRNDNGDFSAVIATHVSLLNRRIDSFNITIEQQILALQLNYYLAQTSFNGNQYE